VNGFIKLLALQAVGNALLLWIGYSWLGVGESNASTLALSIALLLLLFLGALWLHGAAFLLFRAPEQSRVREVLGRALRHLPALFGFGLFAALLFGLLAWVDTRLSDPAFRIASYLTLKTHSPVRPNSVLRILYAITWVLRWLVLPPMLLPRFAAVAADGWAGCKSSAQRSLGWIYRAVAPILLLCAFWLPFRLIVWAPHVSGFGLEVISMGFRFGVAYLLFLCAWLLLASVTSRGNPLFSQPKTVPSP
jgi:hypothetical protein